MASKRRFLGRSAGALALTAAAAGVLGWAGCSCKESQPPAEAPVRQVQAEAPAAQPPAAQPAAKPAQGGRKVGESVLYGPGDYLTTTVITAPRYARKSIDTAYIQNEVNQFQAMEGHYPKSLDELVQWRGQPLPETPKGYVYKYDPATGKLEVVPEG